MSAEWYDQFAPNVWHPMPIPDGASVSLVGAVRNGGTSYREAHVYEDGEEAQDWHLGSWVKNGKLNSAGVEESDWVWYPATHWLWRNVPDITP